MSCAKQFNLDIFVENLKSQRKFIEGRLKIFFEKIKASLDFIQ